MNNTVIAVFLAAIVFTYILGDDGVKNVLSNIIAAAFLAIIFAWMAVMLLGSMEILWWIFTGNFFHFM